MTLKTNIRFIYPKKENIWLWSGYEERGEAKAILKYVDKNAKRLRSKYLEFVEKIGNTSQNGKSLKEHFEIRPGFSFWWMSLLYEKSIYKSPGIVECLKLFAIEEILIKRRPEKVCLREFKDFRVVEAIQKMCSKNLIVCLVESGNFSDRKGVLIKNLSSHKLIHLTRGFWALRYVLRCWSLRKAAKRRWMAGKNSIFLMSYFIHVESNDRQKGIFSSPQWRNFPNFLSEMGYQPNWLHHFVFGGATPNTKSGLNWIEHLNRYRKGGATHRFLYSYLTFLLVIRALMTWFRVALLSLKLKDIGEFFSLKRTDSSYLWPILKDDWNRATFGVIGIQNAIWFQLFDTVLASIPRQRMGLFLFEGQGWESALIQCWKRHGHGTLVGVAHATIRYWDLRYFQSKNQLGGGTVPLPDKIAINGPVAWRTMIDAGCPSEKLVEVEAIRYLEGNKPAVIKRNCVGSRRRSRLRLLVLGDYMTGATRSMMALIERLPRDLLGSISIVVHPHPGNSIEIEAYSALPIKISKKPLDRIINEYDFVYGSNFTSATVDAYMAGLPVIIYLDPVMLNFSPLRNVQGVKFVSNSIELTNALKIENNQPREMQEQFFWRDPDMHRWRKLLTNENF